MLPNNPRTFINFKHAYGKPIDDSHNKTEPLTKRLVLRIIRWAEYAKSDKSGQHWVMGDGYREDLHQAVVIDNLFSSKAGLSSNEKREANVLWKRYGMVGYLTSTDQDRFRTDTKIQWADITGFVLEKVDNRDEGKVLDRCRNLTIKGQKIAAIKEYRAWKDCSLSEAKKVVDNLQTKTQF